MKRKKTLKQILAYVCMPLLFCAAGFGLLCVTVFPAAAPYYRAFRLCLSAPADSSGVSDADTPLRSAVSLSGGTVEESAVAMPAYGTRYASLEIADASVRSDVYFGDSSALLKKGLGQYNGSHLPGYGKPILIGGHNSGAFSGLQRVREGETVAVITEYGQYTYRITGTRIAGESDRTAYDLSQDREQLILYTCYPFNTLGLTSQRFFVYADKVSGPAVVSQNGQETQS